VHRPVTVEAPGLTGGPYIAAVPTGDGDPLLELDEKGNPLIATDSSIRAIEIANGIIEGEGEDNSAIDVQIREVWASLSDDDAGLRELLFERLRYWASEHGEVEELPTLFWLLPWGAFIDHLAWLAFLIRQTERSDLGPSDEPTKDLPEVSHSFKYLIPGLAPSLREITEWRVPSDPITNIAVRIFTSRFRRLSPDQVPPDRRDLLCRHVEDIGRRFQRRLEADWLRSAEHILAAQVMIDLYEVLLDWNAPFEDDVDAGRIKWLGRLALAADAGYFGAGRVKLRQQTIDRLRDTASHLLDKGLWFEDRATAQEWWWDRIFDAGLILYVSASMALTIDREPAKALALTQASRAALERFGQAVPSYRADRWARAFPEAHLLEARCAIDIRDYRSATCALRAIAKALPQVPRLSPPAVKLYRAEIFLCLDEVMKGDAESAAPLIEDLGVGSADLTGAATTACEEVIDANFAHRKAWRMFIPLVKADLAAEKIEAVLARESSKEQQAARQETLEWLEYQLALTARQRADEMPELLHDAFEAYARLLVSQPRNLPAVEELLEMYSGMQVSQQEVARELLDSVLTPMSDRSIPPAHAALRWATRGEVPASRDEQVDAYAIPLVGDTGSPTSDVEVAQGALAKMIDTKSGRRLLEAISKWTYDCARASGDRERLRAVGRLLDPAIAADPSDAIWWSRRADVALTLRDADKADALLDEISSALRDDSIAHFQIGRLLLLQGKFPEADEQLIEAEYLDRKQTGEANPYPAIADRRGFIALLERRYDEAEKQYRQILSENKADPGAHYGLGRVYLQSPSHSLREAMHHWRIALRLRATEPSSASDRYAWRTAAGIAGMISRQVKEGESSHGAEALHEELDELLRVEETAVGERIVKALRVRGVTDLRTAEILQGVAEGRPALSRAVAQYLMARTIHLYIEAPDSWPEFVEAHLPAYLEWCEPRAVLGDFLAGAKGSYARAHMRAETAGRTPGSVRAADSGRVSARKLKKLVNHVVETSYSASYYEDAYGYLRAAGEAKNDQLVAVVGQIVGRLADELRTASEQSRAGEGQKLLAALWPSVGLEAVGTVLGMDEIGDELTAYVDLDVLRYARSMQQLDRWELASTQVIGLTKKAVSDCDRRGYSRAGIGWEVPSEDGYQRCVVDLLDTAFGIDDVEVASASQALAAA